MRKVLVLVAALAAIVVAVLVVKNMKASEEQRRAEAEDRVRIARLDVQHIEEAATLHQRMKKRYPTTEEGVGLLLRDGYLKPNTGDGKAFKDPWGREYIYERPGKAHPDSFDVMTFGADDQPGGDGENKDIVNF